MRIFKEAGSIQRRWFVMLVLTVGTFHAEAQRASMHTERAMTLGLGRVEAGTGITYLSKHRSPGEGYPIAEWRVLTSTLRVGVSKNVDFGLEWRGGLVAELDGGKRAADWGDVQVVTKIHILEESAAIPAVSMFHAVKLPSTRYIPDKLGSNQTDFYFRLLIDRTFHHFEIRANAGFAILGSPSIAGHQDDVFIGGLALIHGWNERDRSFLEVYGFTGNNRSNRKTVIRGGVTVSSSGPFEWTLFGSVRAMGGSDDFGTAFEASENWSIGLFVERIFEL